MAQDSEQRHRERGEDDLADAEPRRGTPDPFRLQRSGRTRRDEARQHEPGRVRGQIVDQEEAARVGSRPYQRIQVHASGSSVPWPLGQAGAARRSTWTRRARAPHVRQWKRRIRYRSEAPGSVAPAPSPSERSTAEPSASKRARLDTPTGSSPTVTRTAVASTSSRKNASSASAASATRHSAGRSRSGRSAPVAESSRIMRYSCWSSCVYSFGLIAKGIPPTSTISLA